jgi:mRNA interferase RelE/StbE
MEQATERDSKEFDNRFFRLPRHVQLQITGKIRAFGRQLESFLHERLQGRNEFRIRVGDYRVIYEFDPGSNEPSLITLGHRRDVYR